MRHHDWRQRHGCALIWRKFLATTGPGASSSDRFGPLPAPGEAMLAVAQLRIVGGRLGVDNILVRGNEARVNFRDTAAPRMKGLSAAFHEVQFQAEVRRAHPLSLKLTRLGGVSILDGLVRALTTLAPA